ncbi:MAG: preprotein translocase subunit YajC [Peptococcales bacterium]
MNNFVLLAVFFGLIYFMMIRPQQKQQKKRREMLGNLGKGDRIVTIGGIEGVIKNIKDDKVVIEVSKGVNITFLKTAIGQVIEEDTSEKLSLEDKTDE